MGNGRIKKGGKRLLETRNARKVGEINASMSNLMALELLLVGRKLVRMNEREKKKKLLVFT